MALSEPTRERDGPGKQAGRNGMRVMNGEAGRESSLGGGKKKLRD